MANDQQTGRDAAAEGLSPVPTGAADDATVSTAPIDPWPTPRDRLLRVTGAWQFMLSAMWIAVFFAYAAVWKASEEIGIGTWWLGARAQPQPALVRMIPFALAVVLSVAAMSNVRRLPLWSLVGSIALAVIPVFDLSRSVGLATIEFAIAAAAAVVSISSFGGRYRVGRPLPPPALPSD